MTPREEPVPEISFTVKELFQSIDRKLDIVADQVDRKLDHLSVQLREKADKTDLDPIRNRILELDKMANSQAQGFEKSLSNIREEIVEMKTSMATKSAVDNTTERLKEYSEKVNRHRIGTMVAIAGVIVEFVMLMIALWSRQPVR